MSFCQYPVNGTRFVIPMPGPPAVASQGIPAMDKFQLLNNIIMIKPLADRVVIEPKEAETKTASGLYIPDTAKEKPQQGTVVAVGPGKKDEAMELSVGETVLYGKYAGTEVTYEDRKYLIMKQSDVLAII